MPIFFANGGIVVWTRLVGKLLQTNDKAGKAAKKDNFETNGGAALGPSHPCGPGGQSTRQDRPQREHTNEDRAVLRNKAFLKADF